MKHPVRFKLLAPLLIAGLVMGGCAATAPGTDDTLLPPMAQEAEQEPKGSSWLGTEKPVEERNATQQVAAGFLAVPAMILFIVLLPYSL